MSITIALDERIVQWLNQEAERRRISIEALASQLLNEKIQLESNHVNEQVFHDLDRLAGTWSDEDAAEFQQAVRDFNQVDTRLWQ